VQSARYEWKASASSQVLLADPDLSFFRPISASTRGLERIILVVGVREMDSWYYLSIKK
jgi:hypothetical protein